MTSIKLAGAISALTLLTQVSAHGVVQGIVANGVYQSGYTPSMQYANPPPVVAGWSIPQDSDLGFVSDYTSPDIICHKGATPGGAYVAVAAGDKIELEWSVWPDSHKGPVIDYLASCGDDCTTVDKTELLFNKIDEAGLINGSPAPGTWASDTLIANNNSWTVTIPSSIAPGKYVLRHEIIALHSANNVGGAQNYPQCINVEVTGSGTNSLSGGTLGTKLYTAQDPGIFVNIYSPPLTSYTIPGPPVLDGTASGTQPAKSSSTSSMGAASSTSITTSASVQITATPTTPAAVISTTTTTTTSAGAEDTECSDTTTSSSSAPIQVAPTSATTNPLSFTSTATGRTGQPTKYVCYVADDE